MTYFRLDHVYLIIVITYDDTITMLCGIDIQYECKEYPWMSVPHNIVKDLNSVMIVISSL